jgi:hypothetical protein
VERRRVPLPAGNRTPDPWTPSSQLRLVSAPTGLSQLQQEIMNHLQNSVMESYKNCIFFTQYTCPHVE